MRCAHAGLVCSPIGLMQFCEAATPPKPTSNSLAVPLASPSLQQTCSTPYHICALPPSSGHDIQHKGNSSLEDAMAHRGVLYHVSTHTHTPALHIPFVSALGQRHLRCQHQQAAALSPSTLWHSTHLITRHAIRCIALLSIYRRPTSATHTPQQPCSQSPHTPATHIPSASVPAPPHHRCQHQQATGCPPSTTLPSHQ